MALTELVLGPIVQMMEVRRRLRSGASSVLSWASHSIRPPSWRWSRAVAAIVGVVYSRNVFGSGVVEGQADVQKKSEGEVWSL